MDLHPAVAPLAGLLGTWRGAGHGEYPTIVSFDYADEWVFSHTGKPFLAFVQRTRSPAGQPMHTESGYLRATGDGGLEIVAALPMGQVELGTGRVTPTEAGLEVRTDATVSCTPSAKAVQRIVRTFRLKGDGLVVDLAMQAVGQPLTHHLASRLERALA